MHASRLSPILPHTLLMRWLVAVSLGFSAPQGAVAESAPIAAVGLQRNLAFTDYSPLSRTPELLRRLLSPLASEMVRRGVVLSGKPLVEQSINLANESFVAYVPPHAPPRGYSLLVFVPPWQVARLPQGWAPVLDRYGMIFVSAARSGNDENVLGRRVPLALLEAENIMRRYPVDPDRIFAAGFSGGSRVALRLALAYPDLFHGALLNAGSDPLDAGSLRLPSASLFKLFQTTTRLVYVTGSDDALHLAMDADSETSMQKHCVYDVDARMTPFAGHEVASASVLSLALPSLLVHTPPDPNRLSACSRGLDAELAASFQRVGFLIGGGKRSAARKLLMSIDTRFGGLAAPRIVDLADKCDCQIFPDTRSEVQQEAAPRATTD